MRGAKVALAAALFTAGVALAGSGIKGTKHDLSASNTNATVRSTTVDEICVFCHTPHHANPTFTGAPIWNKQEPEVAEFTMYGTTVAGTSTDTAPNPPSLACLSCHDGATAINALVNAPGPGYDGQGGGQDTSPVYVEITNGTQTWTEGTKVTMSDVSNYAALGTDLRVHHPISITYTAPNATADQNPASLRPVDTPLTGNWLVRDNNKDGSITIADLLRNGKVECPSCHDPHADNKPPTPVHPMFLRVEGGNKQSQLCLTCHAK
ncbi:MAG: cytochrome c3 family protein [Aquificae bacterium]|nr:cytochrome c3 family protein [Aquificota bacterium]